MSDLNHLLAQEGLKHNLSGRQIMSILDRLLRGALQPIVNLTNLARRGLCDALVQFSFDSRRRFGSLERQETIDSLFSSVVTQRSRDHARLVLTMSMDRSVGSQIVAMFLKRTRGLADIERRAQLGIDVRPTLSSLGRSIGCSEPERLPAARVWAQHYMDLYEEFKSRVVFKYNRLIISQARAAAKHSALPMDMEETVKNYGMAVAKALDKYNADRGALTSYVQQWLKNERTNPEFDPRYAQSFGLSGGSRRDVASRYSSGASGVNNFALSLSVDSVQRQAEERESEDYSTADERVLQAEHVDKMRRLAGWARNSKITMLALGIQFVPEYGELSQLRAQAP